MRPDRRTVAITCVLVGVAAFLSSLAGLHARATYGAATTGDEPYYLVTADSLVRDRDLDIDDELAVQPLPWHEIRMDEQTVALDGGQRLSPHDPLLPALLAPAMAVGGWLAAKALLAMLAGATASLTTWTAIRRLDVRPVTAAVVVGGVTVGMPLSTYGTQVYPELPAALVTLAAVALLLGRDWPWSRRVATSAAVVALPWLAVKYVPVAAVLAGVALWRSFTLDRRAAAWDLGLLGLAAAVYLVVHQRIYGGWTVYAVGDHFVDTGEFGVVGDAARPLGRARRLTGLLVDRTFGIGVWTPLWLAAPAAAGWFAVRMPDVRSRLVVLGPITAGWVTATFVALTMHGFWSPGRQVVVVLPLLAVVLAAWVDRARGAVIASAAVGVAGLWNWLVLAREASTGARTLVVDFAGTTAWPYRVLSSVTPDGIAATTWDDALLGLWTLLFAGSVVWAVR